MKLVYIIIVLLCSSSLFSQDGAISIDSEALKNQKLAAVFIDGKRGVINQQGEIVFTLIKSTDSYKSSAYLKTDFQNDILKVKYGSDFSYVTREGKLVPVWNFNLSPINDQFYKGYKVLGPYERETIYLDSDFQQLEFINKPVDVYLDKKSLFLAKNHYATNVQSIYLDEESNLYGVEILYHPPKLRDVSIADLTKGPDDYTVPFEEMMNLAFNKTNRILIEPKYEELKFCNDILCYREDGKWGVLDQHSEKADKFNVLQSAQYDTLNLKYSHYYSIIAKKDNKWGVLKAKNELLPFVYDHIKPVTEYRYKAKQRFNVTLVNDEGENLITDVDNIVPVGVLANGPNVKKYPYESVNYYIAEKANKYGIFNCNGVQLTPFDYDSIEYADGDLFIVQKGDRYGVLQDNNDILLPIEYKSIKQSFGGYSHQEKYEDNWHFIVQKNKKVGLFTKSGAQLTPFKYSANTRFNFIDNIAPYEIKGKFGLINFEGEEITEALYNDFLENEGDVARTCNGFFIFTKDKLASKFGVLNQNGEEFIQPIYDFVEIVDCDQTKFALVKDKITILVDENSNQIGNNTYESIGQFN